MIDPAILQFVSLLVNGESSGGTQSPATRTGDRNFFSDMQNALHASSKKSSNMAHESLKTESASEEKGYKYYLESFKKKLLAQGKPLNDIFLKESDFPMVKKFLLQCGFSNEKVDKFLQDLKAESPGGQINLSYFFQKASELESPEEKAYKNKIIASSAIPYIESILRDFQFSPNEMDSIINAVKVEGGGLNLDKFVTKLKEISAKKPIADKNSVDQIMSKMEKIGIHLKNQGKIERISLEDFATSLEQTANGPNKNDKLSSEIKGTLDGLMKSVTPSDPNASYKSSLKFSQYVNSTNSMIEEKTDKNHNHLFDGKRVAQEKNKADGNEIISSFIKQKNDKVDYHEQLNVNIPNSKEKADIFSELNKKMELMNPAEKDNYRVQAKTGQMDAPKNTASFNLSDSMGTVGNTDNDATGYLQASLMSQVGKQISRSILRGDQIVRLQLNPPELGTIKIKLDIKDNTLRLAMIAEHHSVKELLLNNIHQLKEALLHQGVKLDKVDVQIDYNFGQSLNGSKEGTNGRSNTNRDFDEKQLNSNAVVQETSVISMKMLSKNNLLDLVA
jgi:flagellar hook-length control protein FliK